MTLYAHSLSGQPSSAWEPLDHHAARVANLARSFAGAFGAGDWGEVLGRWHDLGKASDDFQRYIGVSADPDAGEESAKPGRVDHSTFGAQHAARVVGGHSGQILAFCIAGHHAGIPDATAVEEAGRTSALEARLTKTVPAVQPSAADLEKPQLRFPFRPGADDPGFQVAFFTRMLFSALVDADRLATEQFCNPEVAEERSVMRPSIIELRESIDAYLARKEATAARTAVNALRSSVLAECRAAAPLAPGFFSLNVPTGGGKTLASLAFGLRHAEAHGLRQVIVAIPFTSIIDQTADVYRDALAGLARHGLIEHHSDIQPTYDTRANKLASENWDAPIVVTTNVQLFESLFASRCTPCRKLHRLARTVIILDEAQTLPIDLLEPTLRVLRELVDHYGCTVVLCTATQPALERGDEEFTIGLEGVRPIIVDPAALFSALRRTVVHRAGRLSDDALVDRVAIEQSALCVVNTRPHAARLYDLLTEVCGREGCYHLSTFMCAQHRRDTLGAIRRRLADRRPCRVISTQLVEAGVDLDFPVVFRADAGFDSIAQAAGRCNREGILQEAGQPSLGRVYVFEADCPPPPGVLRDAAQCGRELASRFADPIAPDAVEAYFRLFYWSQRHKWDKHGIMPKVADDLRQRTLHLQFRAVSEAYKIIRDDQVPVLVPYDRTAADIRDRLWRGAPLDFTLMRRAQSYLVPVRNDLLQALFAAQVAVSHESGWWLLVNDAAYSNDTGISAANGAGIDPAFLVV